MSKLVSPFRVVMLVVWISVPFLVKQQSCRAEEPPAATQPSATSAEAIEWLDKIQTKSAQVKTLQADIVYDRNQALVGDKQRRLGNVIFEAGPPKKYAIHFDRLLVDGRADAQNRWYIFDGNWLVERLDDQKQFTKRQLVAPNSPADKSDPLEIGDGPFVLPITAKKERLLQRFDAAVGEAGKNDPANAVHLKLTPKAGQKIDFTQVNIWYDRDSLLPVRVQTLDESEDETVVRLSKHRVNEDVGPKAFDTSEPKDGGWKVEVTPWEK